MCILEIWQFHKLLLRHLDKAYQLDQDTINELQTKRFCITHISFTFSSNDPYGSYFSGITTSEVRDNDEKDKSQQTFMQQKVELRMQKDG